MYHRILTQNEIDNLIIQPGMYVSKEAFEKQIRFLKKNYNILSFNDFLNMKSTDIKKNKQYCILTFDDGWKDNYENAFPVLKTYQIPATIFLPIDYIDTNKKFWPERISSILKEASKGKIKIDILYKYTSSSLINSINHARKKNKRNEIYSKIIENMKKTNDIEITKILDEIENGVEKQKEKRIFLTWNEIKEMSDYNISFGSHGKSHQQLTNLQEAEVVSEIVDSRKILRNKTIQYTDVFCYPNGSYNKAIEKIVSNSSFRSAVTTEYGIIDINTNLDKFALNRIGIHNDVSSNKMAFAFHISGIMQRKK